MLDKKCTNRPSHTLPIPMSEDSDYNRQIEGAIPLEQKQLQLAEKEYGFSYRQALGELIYTMVMCRPDISFPLIKLSQYSAAPALSHFKAIQGIYNYLHKTPEEGKYFWISVPRTDMEADPLPSCPHINNYESQTREQHNSSEFRATVHSDYAGDTSHRRSVTGISVKLAGGCVYYKTRFQPNIALIITEAEFIAACDAAKVILYIRSILDDIGISQDAATTLFEDNQGALLMANFGQPTKRTRHMDTKYFALQ